MNTLYFGNAGVFDPRAMLTFGVSAKENENAIGYFGTGFKYAIAIILRLGGSIEVVSGGERSVFTKVTREIRGKSFDFVQINGADAGFTTRVGINWEPWQAFRELWCNCMDEHGEVSLDPLEFDTVIRVESPELLRAYLNRDQFLLSGSPDVETSTAEIHVRPSMYVFYRGIAVARTGRPALHAYNIKTPVTLTEDRTAKNEYDINLAIRRGVQSLTDAAMLRRILTADPESAYEGTMLFDDYWDTSDVFLSVARELIAGGHRINESARQLLSKKDEKSGNWPEAELTRVQQGMLDRATRFLSSINIDIGRYPVTVVNGLGEGVMGRALDKKIYLSLLPFNMGTKQVASTLLEEFVHSEHDVEDFDRNMQNWLFDKVVSLGEELKGEPV